MPKGENPSSRQNLTPNAAEDKPGPGRSIGVWLPEEQILALDALEGSRAVHIRRAIALYLSESAATPQTAEAEAEAIE